MSPRSDIFQLSFVTVVSLLLSVFVQSCAETGEPVPGGVDVVVDSKPEVGFSISISRPQSVESRAQGALGEGYDTGEGYELFIDLAARDFKFLFFDSENHYVGEFETASVIPTSSTFASKTYYLSGSVPADIDGRNLKIVALANWKTYDFTLVEGVSTIADLTDCIFSFNPQMMNLSETNTIPMYGVSAPEVIEFDANNFARLKSTIHLLRAYAKVEVILDESVLPVTAVEITRVNDCGFKAPAKVYEQDDYVHGNYDDDYLDAVHVPGEAKVIENMPMLLVEGDPAKQETRRYVAYVPEFDNIEATADTKSRIRISYADNPFGAVSYLDFKYYSDYGNHKVGDVFDLQRNNWYRYTVTQTFVHVDVQPYAEVVLTPDFGLERDEEGYIVVRDKEGNIIKYIRPDGEVLTLGPVNMPPYGTINGVFDSKRRALIGYFPDGRQVFFNYEDETGSKKTSWEIYSTERNTDIPIHLEEEYLLEEHGDYQPPFCHNFYDDGGNLIRRYVYESNPAFEASGGTEQGGKKLVEYEGERYGNKVITYYDADTGKPFYRITVTHEYKEETDDEGNKTTKKVYSSKYQEIKD